MASSALLGAVDDLVSDAVTPEPDIHASAEYRAHLAHTLATRAVVAAVRHATDWTPVESGDRDDGDERPRHRGRK